jgi:hypothetical protein
MLLYSGRLQPYSRPLDQSVKAARDKLSSLLQIFVSNEEKKYYNIEFWCQGNKKNSLPLTML